MNKAAFWLVGGLAVLGLALAAAGGQDRLLGSKAYQELSGPKPIMINGLTGLRYQLTGTIEGVRYRILLVHAEGRAQFYLLLALAPPSVYDGRRTLTRTRVGWTCRTRLDSIACTPARGVRGHPTRKTDRTTRLRQRRESADPSGAGGEPPSG